MSRDMDDAAFYQEHMEDPELWGEPDEAAPERPRGNLTASVTVRFSPEEAELIRRAAKEAHISYSEIIRRAVRTFMQPHGR